MEMWRSGDVAIEVSIVYNNLTQYHQIFNEHNTNHESVYQDMCNVLLLYIIFIHKTCRLSYGHARMQLYFLENKLTSGRHGVSQRHLRLPYMAKWTVVYRLVR
jgi:hypothetical protein